MRTSPRIIDAHFGDTLDGGLGIDGTVVVEDPTVAVVGVLAEANVTGDVEGGEGRSEEFDGLDDGSVLVVSG